jgi:hypothetical protein
MQFSQILLAKLNFLLTNLKVFPKELLYEGAPPSVNLAQK